MTQPLAWAAAYVGIPFLERGRDRAGCDCWGLARLVLGERFGVDVPSYTSDYESVADTRKLAALAERSRADGWVEVALPEARPGDVLLLRLSGLPIHVGLVVAPGWMLHTKKATDSVLDRFGGLAWRNRVLGAYRHEDLASTA